MGSDYAFVLLSAADAEADDAPELATLLVVSLTTARCVRRAQLELPHQLRSGGSQRVGPLRLLVLADVSGVVLWRAALHAERSGGAADSSSGGSAAALYLLRDDNGPEIRRALTAVQLPPLAGARAGEAEAASAAHRLGSSVLRRRFPAEARVATAPHRRPATASAASKSSAVGQPHARLWLHGLVRSLAVSLAQSPSLRLWHRCAWQERAASVAEAAGGREEAGWSDAN